jgi:hypothetical protein
LNESSIREKALHAFIKYHERQEFDNVHILSADKGKPSQHAQIGSKFDEFSSNDFISVPTPEGCDSVDVLAGCGEGFLMSREDWTMVAKTAIDHVNGKAPLLVGCATLGTRLAVDMVREAEDLGADAVLAFNPQPLTGPYKNEGLYRHFRALAEAADIQIIPYSRGEPPPGDPVPFDGMEKLVNDGAVKYQKYAKNMRTTIARTCVDKSKSLGINSSYSPVPTFGFCVFSCLAAQASPEANGRNQDSNGTRPTSAGSRFSSRRNSGAS